MAVTYGFYNSLDGDRKYNASQISALFEGIIHDGIFESIGTAMRVTPGTGLNVSVGIGRAWFNNTWTDNDATVIVPINTPDLVLDRIDAIVLEIDTSVGVRANSIKCVKGTAASTPVEPTLTNTAYVHQYPLAYVYVAAGATGFVVGDITSKVGSAECPFVVSIVELTGEGAASSWVPEKLATDAAFLALTTSYQDLVPAPSEGTTRVDTIRLVNEDASITADFFIKIVKTAVDYTIIQRSLAPGESLTIAFPWSLDTSTKIQAKVGVSCTGKAIAAYGTFEGSAAVANFTGDSWTTVLTATVLSFIEALLITNTDATTQTVSFRIINGSSVQQMISSKQLVSNACWLLDLAVAIPAGYALQVKHGASSKTGSIFAPYKEME